MADGTLKRANEIRHRFDDPDLDFRFQWAAPSAGEVLMKAYYCYRQAWQFVGRGDRIQELIGKYEAAPTRRVREAGGSR